MEKVMIYNENCVQGGQIHWKATNDENWEHGDSSIYLEESVEFYKYMLGHFKNLSTFDIRCLKTAIEYFEGEVRNIRLARSV